MDKQSFSYITLPEHPCSYREWQFRRMTLLFNQNLNGGMPGIIERNERFRLMREYGFFSK